MAPCLVNYLLGVVAFILFSLPRACLRACALPCAGNHLKKAYDAVTSARYFSDSKAVLGKENRGNERRRVRKGKRKRKRKEVDKEAGGDEGGDNAGFCVGIVVGRPAPAWSVDIKSCRLNRIFIT